jgi:hypothetical protein
MSRGGSSDIVKGEGKVAWTDVVEERKAAKKRQLSEALDRKTNPFAAAAREYIIDHKTKWKMRPHRWREDAMLLGLGREREQDPGKFAPGVTKGGLCDTWAGKAPAILMPAKSTLLSKMRKPQTARSCGWYYPACSLYRNQ